MVVRTRPQRNLGLVADVTDDVCGVGHSVGGFFADDRDLVTPSTGGGTGEVLASRVGSINNLLVSFVLHGAAWSAINDFQVDTIRGATTRDYSRENKINH